MVKIPLEVYDFANGLRPMAHFLLRSEKPHIFAPIKAIVDTGSPKTFDRALRYEKNENFKSSA
jgi:hypothetical protein